MKLTNDIKINAAYIRTFDPCKEGIDNFEQKYPSFEGSLADLLELEGISYKDKTWLCRKVITNKFIWETFAIDSAVAAQEYAANAAANAAAYNAAAAYAAAYAANAAYVEDAANAAYIAAAYAAANADKAAAYNAANAANAAAYNAAYADDAANAAYVAAAYADDAAIYAANAATDAAAGTYVTKKQEKDRQIAVLIYLLDTEEEGI